MLNKSPKKTRYIAIICLLVVFFIDMITPVEFVVDILYLCCIAIVVKRGTKTIIYMSAASVVLIFSQALFWGNIHHFTATEWINRSITALAILIIAYIAILYQKLERIARLKEQQYLKDLKEMLFITSHKVRKPVANILGLLENLTDAEDEVSEKDLKKHYVYLQISAKELDLFTKELSAFIECTELQNRIQCLPDIPE